MEDTDEKKPDQQELKSVRPLFLGLFCIFSFVFSGTLSLLLLLSVFYSGWITDVINQYTLNSYSKVQLLMIIIGGFILHATAFAGTLKMWKLKKSGYWLFSISILMITVYQLFNHTIPVSYTLLYISLVIFSGFFYRKFR
jgi:hypothetical protein